MYAESIEKSTILWSPLLKNPNFYLLDFPGCFFKNLQDNWIFGQPSDNFSIAVKRVTGTS